MSQIEVAAVAGTPIGELGGEFGVAEELSRLDARVREWIEAADREVTDYLSWQLRGSSKRFRPITVFACHAAAQDEPSRTPGDVVSAALVVELVHNTSLVVDDILDRSRYRRGKLTLHCRFGSLPALMTSAHMVAGAFDLLHDDPFATRVVAALIQRLGAAECLQWRVRRTPLGVEDWRHLAGEDTGVMFEACARLGCGDDSLERFGYLLGLLYHGCDDVADVRGLAGLGGGGEEDLRDGILTLPMAFAVRDPEVAARFRDLDDGDLSALRADAEAALPAAESYLDDLAAQAREAARDGAARPGRLVKLVDYTRELSRC